MKQLNFYLQRNLKTKEKVFEYLLSTFQQSIFTWDYFVDFDKALSNVNQVKDALVILNKLLGESSEHIEHEFLDIITNSPQTRKVLPLLIALRLNKLNTTPIIDNISKLTSENKKLLFNPSTELTDKDKEDLLNFFKLSGLKRFFVNKEVSNLVDYLKGVEVGMDTNGRKNRTGTSMESLCEKFIKTICSEKGYEYISQATKTKIFSQWGVNVKIEEIDRRFDFAIFNKNKKDLTLIEVNFYSANGSKLKATAGEYKELNTLLTSQSYRFIWITDGFGWLSSKASLNETFNSNDYIFNLKMIADGILNEVI